MSVRAGVDFLATEDGGLGEPMASPSQSLLLRLSDSDVDLGVRVATDSGEPLTPGASEEVDADLERSTP